MEIGIDGVRVGRIHTIILAHKGKKNFIKNALRKIKFSPIKLSFLKKVCVYNKHSMRPNERTNGFLQLVFKYLLRNVWAV